MSGGCYLLALHVPSNPVQATAGPTPAGSPPTEGGRPGPRGAQVRVLRPPAVGGRVDVEELGRVAVQLQLLALAHCLVFQLICGRHKTGASSARGGPRSPPSGPPARPSWSPPHGHGPGRCCGQRSDDTEDGPGTDKPCFHHLGFFQLCIGSGQRSNVFLTRVAMELLGGSRPRRPHGGLSGKHRAPGRGTSET